MGWRRPGCHGDNGPPRRRRRQGAVCIENSSLTSRMRSADTPTEGFFVVLDMDIVPQCRIDAG
jgi:hypothetical protein